MKQFAVIGCGRFGSSVAKTLYKSGFDVLALDDDECVIRNIADHVTHAATIDIDDANASERSWYSQYGCGYYRNRQRSESFCYVDTTGQRDGG